jgi:hypothetical protein
MAIPAMPGHMRHTHGSTLRISRRGGTMGAIVFFIFPLNSADKTLYKGGAELSRRDTLPR